jgi:ribonuclease-3
MFAQALALFPSNIPVERNLSSLLEVNELRMARLLGVALEHSSHLYEIGAGESVSALKLLESLGSSMTHLAVAHSIHSGRQVSSAGDASKTMALAMGPLYANLAQHLSLASSARLGASVRADRNQPTPAVLRTITEQVMGAYAMCAGYTSLHQLVDKLLDEPQEETQPVCEFKSALQAYSQSIGRGQPRYTILAETGPGHAKTFTAQVTTDNGRAADGTGTTKKLAEQRAAQQYLTQYAPQFVQRNVSSAHKRSQPQATNPSGGRAVAKYRANNLGNVQNHLNLGITAIPLLDIALTHSSYRSEHPEAPDNTLLAHLGSHALDALATYLLTSTLLGATSREGRDCDSRKVIAEVVSKKNPHLEYGCEILHLTPLLTVGNSVRQIIPAMKAEAFQAIIGATLLARARPTTITDLLPQQLHHWLDQVVHQEHRKTLEGHQANADNRAEEEPPPPIQAPPPRLVQSPPPSPVAPVPLKLCPFP